MNINTDTILILGFFIFICIVVVYFSLLTNLSKRWAERSFEWKNDEDIALGKGDKKTYRLIRMKRILFFVFNPGVAIAFYLKKKK